MILVDSNSICHAEKHAIKNLTWEEREVGVIFGFLRQLLSLAKKFNSNKFVFVWDSRESLREEIFPKYKFKRKNKVKTDEEIKLDNVAYAQFSIIKDEILPILGFKNNFMYEGYEADDLIARIVFKYHSNTDIIIISTDEDLYQLLKSNVALYSIRKKQTYTNITLWKEYRITPDEWGEVKTIAGCGTDEVPGVPNVAEKTAAKYINKKLSFNLKTYRDIKSFPKEDYERNKKLVILPFKGTPEITLFPNNVLKIADFIMIAQRYGFKSMLDKDSLKQWKQYIFKGV